MRRLFGCPDIVSLTEKFLMARNFYRIFTENNPVMGDSKTFGIPKAKGLKISVLQLRYLESYIHVNLLVFNKYIIQISLKFVSIFET